MAAVARVPTQHDVHPLLRHPRPITGDFAKAQRMLGLIADSEEKSITLRREKSQTTKWLERPLYAHLDVSDIESDKEDDSEQARSAKAVQAVDDGRGERLSEQWTTSDRPTSFHSENAVQAFIEPKAKLDTSFVKRRPEPLKSLRPVSYHSQHLLSPEWTASPATMSPNTQCPQPTFLQSSGHSRGRESISSISSSGSAARVVHPQTWPAPPTQYRNHGRAERPVSYQPPSPEREHDSFSSLGSPRSLEQRPRPTSFATYQHRDRRNSKIASSRGLRNNSYPNFSRPNNGLAPKLIPGENIEGNSSYDRFTSNEAGPQLPSSPMLAAADGFEVDGDKVKDGKKSKNRWSTIPQTLKKFTRRRSSLAAEESKSVVNLDDLRRINLTDQSVHWNENEASNNPATPNATMPATTLLPTPSYSPLEFKNRIFEAPLPKPFAPWADAPPSPALSQDKRRSCDMSLSPTRRRTSSGLSIENVAQSRPDSSHSRGSSFAMPSPFRHTPSQQQPPVMFNPTASPWTGSRRGTPILERSCILCKTTKEPAAFVNRRISGNCWHEPATCYQCLQAHIEKCVTTQGWERCTCPECGESMTYEDMGAFADDDDSFVQWDG